MAFSSTPTACDLKPLMKSLQNICSHFLKKVVTNNHSQNGDCALLLTKNGKVFSTGKSIVGCLGLEGVRETAEPVELKELSGVAGACVCGRFGDALAYTREGKVYVWGKNAKPTTVGNTPQIVPELTDVVDAICNRGHYLALTKSGKVYEWRGVNTVASQLNWLSTSPKVVELNDVIMSIACGPAYSLALTKDGQVYSWGKTYIEEYVDQPMTKIPLPGETVAKVACGCTHSLVLTHSGKIYTWDNDCGLGDPSDSTHLATPVEVGQNIGRFVDIAINGHRTNAAVSNTGAIYAWGEGENNAEVRTPTATQCIEMHQVFASLRISQYSWTYKTKNSSPSSNTVILEDSSSIGDKLKASFNDEETSDLTVLVDSKPIFVHKYILRIRSDYFRTFLGERWICRNKRDLVLKSYSYDVFMAYFWFLYSGELTVSPDHLLELWSLCDAYCEDSLKVGVEELMETHLIMKSVALKYTQALTKKEYLIKPEEGGLQSALDILQKDFNELQESLSKDRLKIQDQLHKIEEDCVLQLQQDVGLQEKLKTLKLQVQQDFIGQHNQAAIISQPEKHQLAQENKQEQGQGKLEIHHVAEDNETLKKELAKLQDEFKNLKALLLPQGQDCNEAQIHHGKDVGNLKNELAKLKEDNAKLKEENDKLKDELKHVNAKLQEKLEEDNTKLKNELKEDNTKLKDELKKDNAKLKEELKEDNAKFKSEVKEQLENLKAFLLSQEGKKNCLKRKFRGEEGGTSSRPPIL